MQKRAAVGLGTAALAALAVARARKALGGLTAEVGTFANGMEYARWGDGPKTLLLISAGPGSEVRRMSALPGSQYRPLVEDGFTVWQVTRRRNMPAGHTVSDMADDFAQLIKDQFGGHVDMVVGLSYGGMIAQYLAADHPECLDRVVLALSAARISDWGRDVDYRWAHARALGRPEEAGRVMAEYIFPEPYQERQRRMLGRLLRPAFAREQTPSGDLMVEAEAEMVFDAREALPRIRVPVLLISADEDMFVTPEIVDETFALIPNCTMVRYEGMGHLRAATSGRLARDIVGFVHEVTP